MLEVLVPHQGHPAGELPSVERDVDPGPVVVDTYAGSVQVEWNPDAAVTPLGHFAFFAEYLKLSGRFDALVADCPLAYTSPNAPSKRDVLGTATLSILSGQRRYVHITVLRGDTVNPPLLGMKRVVSEDSVRRGLDKIDADAGARWLTGHLDETVRPLLSEPWILDVDTTVKPLYGHQEGAEIGYNPKKPGRPSHAYHSMMIGGVRLILDVGVEPGNRPGSKHSEPYLWDRLDHLARPLWPALVRGDKDWGNQRNMARCEQEGVPFLFKQRLTKGVRRLLEKVMAGNDWEDAGQGWSGKEAELRLEGWSRQRRVILLRRRLPEVVGVTVPSDDGQGELFWVEGKNNTAAWEFGVLVTSLDHEVRTLAQLYRDRGDSENPFDELKNHWGWGGFTTADLARCQIMARMVALVYNWWTLFTRLADPDHHREALTTRPLLLHGIARQTRHAGQSRLVITASHGRRHLAVKAFQKIAAFFQELRQSAEQLTAAERWHRILSQALVKYLRGRQLWQPAALPTPG